MADLVKHTEYYELKQFKIIRNGENDVELSALIPELYIHESMENDCIRGRAVVVDKTSLLESLPIRGEERLLIEISDAEDQTQSYDMFLYKVDNVDVLGSNDGLTYSIHFCSFTRFVSGLKRICKSYNAYIHEIIQDIFDDCYDITSHGYQDIIKDYGKLSEPSATDSLQHIIIPNMFPHQAMDFLTRRSYSNIANSTSFRFFENTRGYHFINDEDLFLRSPEPMEFTYYDVNTKQDGMAFKQMRHNLLDLQNNKRINTMADISSGAYRNDVVEIDLIKKEVATKPFNYLKEIIDYSKPSGLRRITYHTNSFSSNTFNDENARKFMVIKTNKADTLGSLDPNDHISEMISSKVSYRYHLDKMQISVVSPGHLNLTCGDVVNLVEIYQMIGQRADLRKNEQMSGTYIVRSIERQFVRDNYRDVLLLSKATWEERNLEQIEV